MTDVGSGARIPLFDVALFVTADPVGAAVEDAPLVGAPTSTLLIVAPKSYSEAFTTNDVADAALVKNTVPFFEYSTDPPETEIRSVSPDPTGISVL